MAIYALADVQSTQDGRGGFYWSFNIVGVYGRPLVTFSYETKEEAEAARQDMVRAISEAMTIVVSTR
jgi:hypothetical protein